MDDKELRQQLLGSKKTERIIFAATPELKAALEAVAKDRCISVSAFITLSVMNELAVEKDLIEGLRDKHESLIDIKLHLGNG